MPAIRLPFSLPYFILTFLSLLNKALPTLLQSLNLFLQFFDPLLQSRLLLLMNLLTTNQLADLPNVIINQALLLLHHML